MVNPSAPTPPLVSVVVSNYNYGRFLIGAIESVKAQTYPNVECIVIDDHSTDESEEVLDFARKKWTDLKIERLAVNSGQSAALLAGLALSKGDYVLFLDADDVLFPDCIALHLSVHMSVRKPVGFTCADSFQVLNDIIVTARDVKLAASMYNMRVDRKLMSNAGVNRLATIGIHLPPIDPLKLRYVSHAYEGWPWSTTSSMFFRRDALDLVCGAKGLKDLRIATDNYLAHSINQLTGSILLDEPVAMYRIHGSNGFNKRMPLNNFICHDRADGHFDITRRVLIEDLVERHTHFAANIETPNRVLHICWNLDVASPGPGAWWARRSHFARMLMRHRSELLPEIGVLTWSRLFFGCLVRTQRLAV